jgi:hypothetical protein
VCGSFLKYDHPGDEYHSAGNGRVRNIKDGPSGHAITGEINKKKFKMGNYDIKKFHVKKINYFTNENTID